MEPQYTQLISLAAGVGIAVALWAISHWRNLQLDWKAELKALLGPVAIAVAGMLAAGVEPLSVLVAALTMLGTAVGLNRKASSPQ